MAGTVEGMHPGILHLRNPEHRDLDPVWKGPDEGGKERPFDKAGKGCVAIYKAGSWISQERTMHRQSCSLVLAPGGEGTKAPRQKVSLGNRPSRLGGRSVPPG